MPATAARSSPAHPRPAIAGRRAGPRARPLARRLGLLLLLGAGLALAACQRAPSPAADAAGDETAALARPAQAVRLLTRHLREDDFGAFARDAVPPALHARLESAWSAGRTRWPLDELPFGRRLPGMLASLSAPDASARLQRIYDGQFARADRQIHAAAVSLGVFGAQYLQQQGDYSDDERQHYAQIVAAVSAWGARAPLGDPKRARAAIATLTAAARRTRLASDAAFAQAGMAGALERIGPFAAACKRVLASYGWDLDKDLAGMDVSLQQQTGDTASVRLRYTLAGSPVDTVVAMRRLDGRWYVADFLRHAEAAAGAQAPAAAQRPAGPASPSPPAARPQAP